MCIYIYTYTYIYIYIYIYTYICIHICLIVCLGNHQDVFLFMVSVVDIIQHYFMVSIVVFVNGFRRRRKRCFMVSVVGFLLWFPSWQETFVYGFRACSKRRLRCKVYTRSTRGLHEVYTRSTQGLPWQETFCLWFPSLVYLLWFPAATGPRLSLRWKL